MNVWLVLKKNVKVDPIYLPFAYFFPPGSEGYQKWYSEELHCIAVIVCGVPCFLEGGRILCFSVLNNIILSLCADQCLQRADQTVNMSMSISVARQLERGLKVYDTFCIIHLRGAEIMAKFEALLILGVGYAVLLFNASATVTAWDHLPPELAWAIPTLTLLGLFMLLAVLPYTISCYSYSERILRKWMLLARQSRNTKCIRKQLASRLPVGFLFGDFRPVNNEFRLVYLESVGERTSNQILVYNSGKSFGI